MAEVFESLLGDRPITLETGRLAKQAGGAVFVKYGGTAVLATATASREPRQGIDFFPLTVDYEERQYAAGKIPGNWFRREGRPTARAILSARLIDRPIRPMFAEGFRNDVQVIVTVMSVDQDHPPEICGMIGASAALSISDIPFEGPLAGCIVGRVDGQFVANPTAEQARRSDMHLVVAGTRDAILMVEAGAIEVPEEVMLDAIMFGHRAIQPMIDLQLEMAAKVGKPKRQMAVYRVPEEVERAVRSLATERIRQALRNADKQAREEAIAQVGQDVQAALAADFPEQAKDIDNVLHDILKEEVRRDIVERGARPDGRDLTTIRPIACDVGVLPRTHGTGLFQRGQTQVLTVATLGTVGDVQRLDDLTDEEEKRYMHHYNFPPYSTGETRPMRGPGRREIGHGALAERALEPMIPSEEEFPYTIRLVSEVLESNGSTSMASVCGSTLALMDAGVPIKAPVAGVAMGLVKEGERVAVLTDIQGIEDHLGDMDFKVAGTRRGVTALQMDIKIRGVTREILARALAQAREGRLFILHKMLEVLPGPRPELSPYAPRIIIMKIDPDRIRDVIGPGGKTINRIIAEASPEGDKRVTIDIEDDGTIFIGAVNMEAGEKARRMIEELVREVEVGQVYTGKVTRLMNFGAFVEILPGKEGLVHISELDLERVPTVEDAVQVGDEVTVQVVEIDKMGRINLSRREVLRKQFEAEGRPLPEREPVGAGRPGGRSGRDGGRPGGPPRRDEPPMKGDRPYRTGPTMGDDRRPGRPGPRPR